MSTCKQKILKCMYTCQSKANKKKVWIALNSKRQKEGGLRCLKFSQRRVKRSQPASHMRLYFVWESGFTVVSSDSKVS